MNAGETLEQGVPHTISTGEREALVRRLAHEIKGVALARAFDRLHDEAQLDHVVARFGLLVSVDVRVGEVQRCASLARAPHHVRRRELQPPCPLALRHLGVEEHLHPSIQKEKEKGNRI